VGRRIVGEVLEKTYRPPPGAPSKYWCYVMVETESGERMSIRLHQKVHDKITVGDRVRFEKPWRENKRVKDVDVVRG
jgi:uncharacterized OB-fold protein